MVRCRYVLVWWNCIFLFVEIDWTFGEPFDEEKRCKYGYAKEVGNIECINHELQEKRIVAIVSNPIFRLKLNSLKYFFSEIFWNIS